MKPEIFGSYDKRYLTGFFDTKDAVDQARDALIDAGYPSSNVVVDGHGVLDNAVDPEEGSGFWSVLKNFLLPTESRLAHDAAAHHGGYSLTLPVAEAEYDRVLSILDRNGAIDMNDRDDNPRWERRSGDLAARGIDETATNIPDAMMPGLTPMAGQTPIARVDEDRFQSASRPPHALQEPGVTDAPEFDTPPPVDHVTADDRLVHRDTSEEFRRKGEL